MFEHEFWKYSGIALWGIIVLYLLIRLIYGSNWPFKLGSTLFLGPGLKTSAKKLVREVRNRDIKDETLTEVAVHVFWRFTRIGIIGIIITGLPIWLLMQQNGLLRIQNDLFSLQDSLVMRQNDKIDSQLVMLSHQNLRIDQQTVLLEEQTKLFGLQNDLITDQNRKLDFQSILFGSQNDLFQRQNEMIDTQNLRINFQNNLLEADRRSSLVFLMSNILDNVDKEIKESERYKDSNGDSIGYRLSDPLIGRIIAVSRAFRPYKILEADTLNSKLVSPERGHLFIALMESNLDSFTLNTIVEKGDFSYSALTNTALRPLNLINANLENAHLSGSNLKETNLTRANLKFAELVGTNLPFVKLNWADLTGADLRGAFLVGAELKGSFLTKADIRGALLQNANLEKSFINGTDLSGADLRGANVAGADMFKTNLHNAKVDSPDWIQNLYSLKVKGASEIDSLFFISHNEKLDHYFIIRK